MELKNKNAIISDGSRGLGKAAPIAFAKFDAINIKQFQMKIKALLILLFAICNLNAQNSSDFILTNEQNKVWVEKLQSQNLAAGIAMINQRLLTDTNVYYSGASISNEKKYLNKTFKAKTSSRPLYIFLSMDGKSQIVLENNPSKQAIQKLTELLKPENVLKINSSNEKKDTAAMYGLRASGGVLFITLKNDEAVEKIKSLQF